MKQFNNYFNEEVTIGLTEYIDINGIGKVKAKVDSGNQGYNVIHGINVTPIADNKVKFQTINNQTVSFIKHGFIKIHVGQTDEMRPVIHLSFKLGTQFFENVPFSIADRSKNDEPVLIGEPFLKKINALIDVNKAQIHETKKMSHGPLVSGTFVSEDDKFNYYTKKKEKLLKIMEQEWSDLGVCQSQLYHKARTEYDIVKEKLRKMEKVNPDYAVSAFNQLLNRS